MNAYLLEKIAEFLRFMLGVVLHSTFNNIKIYTMTAQFSTNS